MVGVFACFPHKFAVCVDGDLIQVRTLNNVKMLRALFARRARGAYLLVNLLRRSEWILRRRVLRAHQPPFPIELFAENIASRQHCTFNPDQNIVHQLVC
jgi:hypothetical protein